MENVKVVGTNIYFLLVIKNDNVDSYVYDIWIGIMVERFVEGVYINEQRNGYGRGNTSMREKYFIGSHLDELENFRYGRYSSFGYVKGYSYGYRTKDGF